MKALLGTKVGMTQLFGEDGTVTPVTVIQAGPCVVTQKKNRETDGYDSTQIAYGDVKARKLSRPELGHLKKAGADPKKHLIEVPGESELGIGDSVTVEIFAPGERVKVSGVSKGKGFQGVVKRHGFRGGPGSHGAHFHRAPGSIGASADPARVYPGTRLPGHMGSRKVTQLGLTVVRTDTDRNLLLVKGAVPGSSGSLVVIKDTEMPTITKIDETGTVLGEHALPDYLVEEEANIGLIHEVVRSEFASYRQGTASAKSRGQVSGSGAKPWRQKGTGRARAGSTRVSHWTGGGMAFPPVPRDHSFKVNKKARAKAFRQALGNLVQGGGVRVLAVEEFDEPSTKRAAAIIAGAGLDGPTLVVGSPDEYNLLLSFRNLAGTRVLPLTAVEVQDYVWARSAVITAAAAAMLEGGEI